MEPISWNLRSCHIARRHTKDIGESFITVVCYDGCDTLKKGERMITVVVCIVVTENMSEGPTYAGLI